MNVTDDSAKAVGVYRQWAKLFPRVTLTLLIAMA
jgi:hypothetical protein